MKKTFLALLLLLFAAQGASASAASKFTGIMDMALTMPNGSAKVTYWFGATAQRMDMVMQMSKIPEPLNTTARARPSGLRRSRR